MSRPAQRPDLRRRPASTSTRARPWSSAIKPLAKATRRPGADASLGGFGALFDLKAAGYDDPLLVTTTDGVGTKLKVAIETGLHDTVGIDLVAMCVNDLLAQGAEPLLFLDYYATGKLDVEVAARGGRRHRRGLPAGRLRPGRRRDGRDARHVRPRATTTWPASASAPWTAARCCRGWTTRRPGDMLIGLASSGPALQRLFPGPPHRRALGPGLGRAGAVRGGQDPGRGPDGADAHLCEERPAAAEGRADQGRRPHHRRRPDREPAARHRRGPGPARSTGTPGPCRRCSTGCSRSAASSDHELRRTFNCGVGFDADRRRRTNVEPVLAALLNAGETAFVCGQLQAA